MLFRLDTNAVIATRAAALGAVAMTDILASLVEWREWLLTRQ